MVRAAALFSGKDSLYATYLAERSGINVSNLITMVTTFNRPSGHIENLDALRVAADSMRKDHAVVDLRDREGGLVDAIKGMGVGALVAGDVCVEDHLRWLEGVCKRAGVGLIEPLYGKETAEVLEEMLGAGFIAKLICVDTSSLGEEWLGFELSRGTLSEFVSKVNGIDLLGENGEYHTIVIDCPLYTAPLRVVSSERHASGSLRYLAVKVSP
ncbi:MAG: ATP pyrophosphatase [Candidatus Methanosuratus sp.]|nr:ATP pyrophosphatase [Candidatus Methanosuratincola sp.]